MESVIAAIATGLLALVGVIYSNSRNRAVMEFKIDALTKQVEKHNRVVERTFHLEQEIAVAKNDIETLYKRTEADR